jgi:hypothetical protein
MSTTITFPQPDGAQYIIPAVDDENWGQNVSDFLIAIPNGVVPRSGTFSLTGDVNFGASFGLIAKYITSESGGTASAGMFRLAHNDIMAWRNAAGTGNLNLTTNGSDQLTFNGSVVSTAAAFPLTVTNGGTGDSSLTAYAVLTGGTTSTGAVQSVASVGSSGQVLTSNGASALPTFQNATGTGTVNSGTSNQLAYYATSSATISGNSVLSATSTGITATAAGATIIASSSSASASRLILADSTTSSWDYQWLGDATSVRLRDVNNTQDVLTYTHGTNILSVTAPLAMGANKITGVTDPTAAQDAATKNYVDTTHSVVSAASGGGAIYVSTGVGQNVTSISLTAGRWLITAGINTAITSSTWSSISMGISTTSGSLAGLTQGLNATRMDWVSSSTTPTTLILYVPNYYVTPGTTTTYFLNTSSTFSAGNPTVNSGNITAVRIGF